MWKLTNSERLSHWRDFRKSLDRLSFEQALEAIAVYWQTCPFVPYYLDNANTESWPGPWQMIDDNIYCDLARCLGIVYTIILTKHRMDVDVELQVYQDPRTGFEYNLACFSQGKYILNMIDSQVVNIEQLDKTFQLKYRYTAVDLKLDNY